MSTEAGPSAESLTRDMTSQRDRDDPDQQDQSTHQTNKDSQSTRNGVRTKLSTRDDAGASHRTSPNSYGREGRENSSGSNVSGKETTSNGRKRKKKSSSKKSGRLISPKMIFLKRKLKHFYQEMEADKKAVCGKITCKNMKVFVGIYALLFVIRAAFRQYFTGILEHIQRHFTLSMRELEFLVGVEKIGFVIIIIFASYYGNKMNKPVAIFAGAVICACGAILCAVPYFTDTSNEPKNITDAILYYDAGLCQVGSNESKTSKTQCEAMVHHPQATQAFSILATGNFLVGIGSAFLITLGFIYIEETTPKDTAPLYYGIILCMNGVGETLGLVAAWQFTQFSYLLSGSLELVKWSIGAWWLALPILTALFILASFPLLLFPKWIIEPNWLVKRRRRQARHWLSLIRAEEKLINKIKRRMKRKKRKEEIAKRKKERAKREAESAARNTEATADDTGDESLDGTKQVGDPFKTNHSYNTSGDSGVNEDINVENEDVTTNGGTTASQVNIATSVIDVEVYANVENGHTSEIKEHVLDNSDEDSDNEETSSGRSSPQIHDSQDIPVESELKLHELGATEPDKADAAPQRGVRFATDGAGDILVEVGMEVDDVLQMEEPLKVHAEDSDSPKTDQSEKEKKRKMLGRKLQDLSKNLWFLINRPVLSLVLVGTLLAAYSPGGYQATLPAYLASELPMYNPPELIVAGLPYTVGLALGAIVAGVVMYKRDWKLQTHIKIILVLQAVVIILFLIAMAPSCDVNYFFKGPVSINVTESTDTICSSRCDCRDAQFELICSRDGVVFPSSCMAGCRRARLSGRSHVVYDQCLCLPDMELSSGFCNNGCYVTTVGYGVLVFLISLCQSFGQVSLLIICLRCIAQKLRSLALGFAVFVVLLAAYVPGTAVFRYLGDVACHQKQEDCLEDDVCWYSDKNTYRYIHHGAAAAFQLISVIFYLATLFVLRAKAKAMSKVTDASERSEVTLAGDSTDISKVADDGERSRVMDNEDMLSNGVENKAFDDIQL